MNHQKHEKNKKDSKHKFTYECLTKCVKWKLNVTLSYNKSSSGLVNNINKIINLLNLKKY